AVAMCRIVCKARQLQVDHAEDDLLRRDFNAQCRRPAPCDLLEQWPGRPVLPSALADDAGGLGEKVGACHADAPTKRGFERTQRGILAGTAGTCGYCFPLTRESVSATLCVAAEKVPAGTRTTRRIGIIA